MKCKKICLICGSEFEQSPQNVGLCSIGCRNEYTRRAYLPAGEPLAIRQLKKKGIKFCSWCGVSIDKGRKRCTTCASRVLFMQIRWSYEPRPMIRLECKRCSRTIETREPKKKYCDKCRVRSYKIDETHKQRAERYGVDYEPISNKKVFDADGWRCRQCGCKVRYSKRSINRQATLDHIVPMSKGGSHTYANVQCLCRECNTNKATGNAARQLRFAEMVR